MPKKLQDFIGKIHQGDCIKGMKKVPDESVQLVFADPPFNIGYEYDEYDDRLDSEKYIEWSRKWMQQVHRVLDSTGTFWLAIGDEYAAELKLEAQKVGFHPRSWVIWYYTFGVNCQNKFTRSHAHLFHFVKDKEKFTFNRDAIAVPSARQLIYGDKRANPKGRLPDDTWILRPQDCVDGFTPDEDMWHFPRVAGTFKERAGFHGCQMPEKLLERIIRSCSNPDDVVVDPFSGSATTIAVAKKCGRKFFSFELSKDYAKLGRQRVDSVTSYDLVEGTPDTKIGSSDQKPVRRKKAKAVQENRLFDFEDVRFESAAIVESFCKSNRGYSVDRMVADPLLNEDFQLQCDRRKVPGTHAERNRFLFRLRKSGQLKQAGMKKSKITRIGWDQIDTFLFASEIAWRRVSELYADASLDDIFCDPRLASKFDEIAAAYSPGFTSLEYRWAALKLRKEGRNARRRADASSPKKLGIQKFRKLGASPLDGFDFDSISNDPGVYALRTQDLNYVYAGETNQLSRRLKAQFGDATRQGWPELASTLGELELVVLPLSSIMDARFARQSQLLSWYKPSWNHNAKLAA